MPTGIRERVVSSCEKYGHGPYTSSEQCAWCKREFQFDGSEAGLDAALKEQYGEEFLFGGIAVAFMLFAIILPTAAVLFR